MQGSKFTRYATLPVRLLIGYGFIEHGFAKLSRGPDAFAGMLQQLGVPLPHLAGWLTIGTEILGGVAILLGFLVFWASIPLAFVLLVAMITIHLPYGFSSVRVVSISASGVGFGPVGYEVDLLYLAALLMFALQGPGPLALDNVLHGRPDLMVSSEKERSSALSKPSD
ncbi:MAG TPA: DoxX family protein [Candidatus Angelobacter sp.]|jgi:putative oxidoreductase